MSKTLKRAVLGALFILVAAPSMASAALTSSVSLSTVTAGCGPKGALAIPAAGGIVPAGPQQYKITAVVGGTETAPCAALPAGGAGATLTALQWAATPGATEYRIYRNDARIQQITPSATSCPTTNAAGRCQFIDTTGNAAAGVSGTAPALPSAVTQAGASPDLNILQTFDYAGAANTNADDNPLNGTTANSASLKDNVLHFPAGLLANPTAATTTCSISQLIGAASTASGGAGAQDANEDKCPRASQVGTVLASIQSTSPNDPANPATPTVGDIYIGQKLASDGAGVTARLFVALRPPCSAGYPAPLNPGSTTCDTRLGGVNREVEKSFLSAKASIRQDGTFGIDNETTSVATGVDEDLAPVSNVRSTTNGALLTGVPIQVRRLTQQLFGSADQGTAATADDKPFVLLPTSCAAKTFSTEAASYLNPTPTSTATAPLQATGCAAVPFGPVISATLDANGQTQQNGHPGFVARITQNGNEAATQNAVVTLPSGLGTNLDALGRICTTAQAASAAGCPATSQVGTASATTPVLPGTLAGPVFIAENASPYNLSGLPKLIVVLDGAARIRLDGAISFDATNTRLVNTFANLPEVTLSTFTLSIAGGTGGLLQNTRDICTTPLGNIDAAFAGYNGGAATRTVAVDSNQAYYCIDKPDPTPKVKPGLSLKVKPKTDKRKPFKFTATGKVSRKSAPKGKACKGTVKLVVKKGKKTLDKATAKVKKSCTYAAKIKLSKKAGKKGKAVVQAKFGGNSVLKASKTVKKSVKYGGKKKGGKKGGKKGNK